MSTDEGPHKKTLISVKRSRIRRDRITEKSFRGDSHVFKRKGYYGRSATFERCKLSQFAAEVEWKLVTGLCMFLIIKSVYI